MDHHENNTLNASRLRLPQTRLPQAFTASRPGAMLTEITDSQTNRLNQQTMVPPARKNLKHPLNPPAQEPEPKRKTLADRAGEYHSSGGPSVTSRPPVSGTSLMSGFKQPGSGLPAPRANSGLPRNTSSNSSFSSTIGHGSRPPSAASNRPAGQFSKSTYGRPRSKTQTRPATAMSHRGADEEPEPQPQGKRYAWDVDERLTEFDTKLDVVKDLVNGSLSDRKLMEDTIAFLKSKLSEAEAKNESLMEQLDTARRDMNSLSLSLESEKRSRQHDVEDRIRDHRNEMDQLRRDLTDEAERQRREHREQLEATERHWKNTLDDLEAQKAREIQELRAKLGSEQDDLNLEMSKKNREVENMRGQLEDVKGNLDRERTLKDNLSLQLSAKDTSIIQLEAQNRSLQARIDFLESGSKAQSDSFAKMESELREAGRIRDECKEKLIKEETERRILFNKYQELKGNIRVMCRVRPPLDPSEGETAKIQFPDLKTSTEIQIMGPEEKSSLGNVSRKPNNFEFDRVFAPGVQNEDVFGEISQLVQSALDGYNVCIFCYGQTGSGKTFTMSSPDGMIPRATHMIYDTITKLKDKSWAYTMQGSFVEVYNEELHDLLGDSGKKLEIRHDEQKKKTHITNCHSVSLDSAEMVESMLERAQKNRSVAATKANEHSSRSHSVFILRLSGENFATGERCEGTLNLVDLAGSERLKHSQAEGDRMKETQNINKSLSSLGDVIEALGNKARHIPYRNSKLTHLLQYSLGGNSKTLMFVMMSPLETHLQETLASLKFATKVYNTHIGTAKTTKKVATKSRSSDS